MEVDEAEVLYMLYTIPKSDWKAEEKRILIDEENRMWSAPRKGKLLDENSEEPLLEVHRTYHRAGQIIAEAMTKAGEFLKLRCPLAGEYKVGDSWAETH